MSDDSDNFEFSDQEFDDTKHNKIVENVLKLNKAQNVKSAYRTEPTSHVSEFNLVKSLSGNQNLVHINELSKVLSGRKKHLRTSNKIKSVSKTATLPTPLEKPQAERIKRTLNYEKSRLEFDRWEALVTSNRAAPQLSFPLNHNEKLKIIEKKSEVYPSSFKIKSDLQKKLESIEPKVEEYHIETEEKDEFPLTLNELKEKRKEAAKLRAHQSFKEAKARQQNKIKSKKYHRILRREKIKKKLKEFEELQKTNPEEALKKLEDIDKARAEERFSLRHKGTGQWARNKQIRAKYDKESRQVLAQQLAISRDLTQKLKSVDSDSEDEGIQSDNNQSFSVSTQQDENNPWVNGVKPTKDIADFVSGYRKYWNEQNNVKTSENHITMDSECTDLESKTTKTKTKKSNTSVKLQQKQLDENKINGNKNKLPIKDKQSCQVTKKTKKRKSSLSTSENHITTNSESPDLENKTTKTKTKKSNTSVKLQQKKLKENKINGNKNTLPIKDKQSCQVTKKTKKRKSSISTTDWEVSQDGVKDDVEDIFEALEENLNKKLNQKLKKLKSDNKSKPNKITKLKKTNKKKKIDLSMPLRRKKQIIDEELLEQTNKIVDDTETRPDFLALKSILASTEKQKSDEAVDINPNKFIQIKSTNLNTAVPDIVTTDENEEISQKDLIIEAFEDDDIVTDFDKEKAAEIEKETPKDIDLNLPGWGSWAGTGIDHSKRKRKRFIIKMPPKMPRKDDNKGSLIINEKAQAKIKPLLVSEVPFPFKSVKDYEASIRAPISNTFVPETAYKRFIEPAVVTKMGTVIEPINKGILTGIKKKI